MKKVVIFRRGRQHLNDDAGFFNITFSIPGLARYDNISLVKGIHSVWQQNP